MNMILACAFPAPKTTRWQPARRAHFEHCDISRFSFSSWFALVIGRIKNRTNWTDRTNEKLGERVYSDKFKGIFFGVPNGKSWRIILVGDIARVKQSAIVDNLGPRFVGVAVKYKIVLSRLAELFGNFGIMNEGNPIEG